MTRFVSDCPSWVVPFVVYFVPYFCLGLCSINHEVTLIIWTSTFEVIPCVVRVIATEKIVSSVRTYDQQMENLHSQLRYNQTGSQSSTIT